jgi:hypothetical protein
MRIIRLVLGLGIIAGVSLFAACGGPTKDAASASGPSAASAHVDGKIKGQALEARDAIAYTMPALQGMRILISNQTGVCGKVWKSDFKIRGIRGLQFVVAEDRGAPKSPGVFLVNDGSSARFAVGGYVSYDDQCKELEGGVDDSDTGAVTGKLTIDEIDLASGGHVNGSFDLRLKDGDHVTGSFSAPYCTKPDNVEAATFNPVCQ